MLVLVLLGRLVSLVAGLLLVYAAWFMYEPRERRVQNALEAWWIRIDDLRRTAVATHVAIMNVAAQLALRALDRLFGVKLYSFRVIAVAGLLSLASLHFSAALLSGWANHVLERLPPEAIAREFPDPTERFVAAIVVLPHMLVKLLLLVVVEDDPAQMNVLCGMAVAVVIASALFRRLAWLPGFTFSAICLFFAFVGVFAPGPNDILSPIAAAVAMGVGIISDVITFAVTRKLLRWQAFSRFTLIIIAAAAAELGLFLFVIVAPPILGGVAIADGWEEVRSSNFRSRLAWYRVLAGWSMMTASLTNLLAAWTALAFFGSAILLAAHRLIWPVIERPLYQLARIGVFTNRGARAALAAIGLALITFATGHGGAIFPYLLRLFGSA